MCFIICFSCFSLLTALPQRVPRTNVNECYRISDVKSFSNDNVKRTKRFLLRVNRRRIFEISWFYSVLGFVVVVSPLSKLSERFWCKDKSTWWRNHAFTITSPVKTFCVVFLWSNWCFEESKEVWKCANICIVSAAQLFFFFAPIKPYLRPSWLHSAAAFA